MISISLFSDQQPALSYLRIAFAVVVILAFVLLILLIISKWQEIKALRELAAYQEEADKVNQQIDDDLKAMLQRQAAIRMNAQSMGRISSIIDTAENMEFKDRTDYPRY